MSLTMQQLLAQHTERDNLAVVHDTGDGRQLRWTWKEYIERASRQAATIIEHLDTRRPLHVGALLGNTPAMLTAIAAAALGGYVLCGINDTRRGGGLLADITTADVQILLTDAEHRHLLDHLDLATVRVIDVDDSRWQHRCDGAGALTPIHRAQPADPFMMIFTSGTSGDPKAVLVSHHMVVFAGRNLVDRFGLDSGDVCYLAMPMFHSNGIVAGFAPAVTAGATMAPSKFSASGFLDEIRSYRATYMNYVGKPLAYVLATPARPDDSENTLRVAFGNEASDQDIERFSQRFGVRVVDAFGSTENAVIIIREEGTPPGSVGRGLPGVAIYHSDPIAECPPAVFDDHGVLTNPDAAIGELVNTAGAGFFSGYYNNEEASAERMRAGIYWSGDLGYKDSDGWIYLAGRTADWMRVDGENLTSAPIERILQRHPDISRVAIYPVPDDLVGDQIMAAIVPRSGSRLDPGEFGEFLTRQEDLSPKAWPRFVRIATELPTTATNKILKRVLVSEGTDVRSDILWTRLGREHAYRVVGD
ncbi:AMP-binding protein [Nocardia higoensis]|uniref:AMP-binding protein n=1 Tax=Nocardia higoensis TaxID=228599 RepID=A0ABS0D630_9NOCA|nr:fatty-acid--CoA ligase FadD1 [Nocardia higoensis]MBF6353932.1 AMP-binding protein [Nocardia higoensis]